MHYYMTNIFLLIILYEYFLTSYILKILFLSSFMIIIIRIYYQYQEIIQINDKIIFEFGNCINEIINDIDNIIIIQENNEKNFNKLLDIHKYSLDNLLISSFIKNNNYSTYIEDIKEKLLKIKNK